MKNTVHHIMVYNVLIKPGGADIHPQNGRITRDTRLF